MLTKFPLTLSLVSFCRRLLEDRFYIPHSQEDRLLAELQLLVHSLAPDPEDVMESTIGQLGGGDG